MGDVIKDFIIPIATFALGVIFTMLWDKRKKRNADFNSAANKLSELTNDWYNQLYNLNSQKLTNSKEYEKELFFYSQNRLVLPEYLKIITFLKDSKKHTNLVNKAESFLEMVTNYQKNSVKVKFGCTFCFAPPSEYKESGDSTLTKLDALLQEIAIETGNSL